ncbi:TIGR04282 family arsenosugar biosynthesis glycosyltransferase [Reichenbachiella sp.]|uniref:TIGR04282 family arsenosugar biosynthesis glycosyltransferase n=1 Tax=Reichenbachiella sp. TaxID=2184521 RepID=UPI003BB0B7D3
MSNEALIIFAKNPELGKVKTRLAQSVGNETALDIYHKLVAYTQEQTANIEAERIVYYTQDVDHNDNWRKAIRKVQASGDLGHKMAAAFREELKQYDRVCIVGADCAELTSAHIQQAFQKLKNNDFVLGPANDGGYYLLGMKAFEPGLFAGIDWSTDKVLSQTIEAISELNNSYALLPKLIDVDTIEDWKQVSENFK